VSNEKSKKVKAKKLKDGLKYIVFSSLPIEQQKAWNKQGSAFSVPILSEEPKDAICIHYYDYEKFYDAWVEGRVAVHLD
jgi:hypothetical protein